MSRKHFKTNIAYNISIDHDGIAIDYILEIQNYLMKNKQYIKNVWTY